MKYFIIGASGFMGRNLSAFLKEQGIAFLTYDRESSLSDLKEGIFGCDVILHFAGVMRPKDNSEFYDVTNGLNRDIMEILKNAMHMPLFIFASSIQATLDNDYGKSKLLSENYFVDCQKKYKNFNLRIYRFSNSFGKGGLPNYNSVLSTFCYNISHNLDVFVRDPNYVVPFIYIDDIIDDVLKRPITSQIELCSINPVSNCSLENLKNSITYFKNAFENGCLPGLNDRFMRNLFLTFLSYNDLKDLIKEGNTLFSGLDFTPMFIPHLKDERNGYIIKMHGFSGTLSIRDLFNKEYIKNVLNKDLFVILPPGFEFSANSSICSFSYFKI